MDTFSAQATSFAGPSAPIRHPKVGPYDVVETSLVHAYIMNSNSSESPSSSSDGSDQLKKDNMAVTASDTCFGSTYSRTNGEYSCACNPFEAKEDLMEEEKSRLLIRIVLSYVEACGRVQPKQQGQEHGSPPFDIKSRGGCLNHDNDEENATRLSQLVRSLVEVCGLSFLAQRWLKVEITQHQHQQQQQAYHIGGSHHASGGHRKNNNNGKNLSRREIDMQKTREALASLHLERDKLSAAAAYHAELSVSHQQQAGEAYPSASIAEAAAAAQYYADAVQNVAIRIDALNRKLNEMESRHYLKMLGKATNNNNNNNGSANLPPPPPPAVSDASPCMLPSILSSSSGSKHPSSFGGDNKIGGLEDQGNGNPYEWFGVPWCKALLFGSSAIGGTVTNSDVDVLLLIGSNLAPQYDPRPPRVFERFNWWSTDEYYHDFPLILEREFNGLLKDALDYYFYSQEKEVNEGQPCNKAFSFTSQSARRLLLSLGTTVHVTPVTAARVPVLKFVFCGVHVDVVMTAYCPPLRWFAPNPAVCSERDSTYPFRENTQNRTLTPADNFEGDGALFIAFAKAQWEMNLLRKLHANMKTQYTAKKHQHQAHGNSVVNVAAQIITPCITIDDLGQVFYMEEEASKERQSSPSTLTLSSSSSPSSPPQLGDLEKHTPSPTSPFLGPDALASSSPPTTTDTNNGNTHLPDNTNGNNSSDCEQRTPPRAILLAKLLLMTDVEEAIVSGEYNSIPGLSDVLRRETQSSQLLLVSAAWLVFRRIPLASMRSAINGVRTILLLRKLTPTTPYALSYSPKVVDGQSLGPSSSVSMLQRVLTSTATPISSESKSNNLFPSSPLTSTTISGVNPQEGTAVSSFSVFQKSSSKIRPPPFTFYNDVFAIALKFIKRWARRRGIYGNLYGYAPGVAWAILAVRGAQAVPSTFASVLLRRFFKIIPDLLASLPPNLSSSSTSLGKTLLTHQHAYGLRVPPLFITKSLFMDANAATSNMSPPSSSSASYIPKIAGLMESWRPGQRSAASGMPSSPPPSSQGAGGDNSVTRVVLTTSDAFPTISPAYPFGNASHTASANGRKIILEEMRLAASFLNSKPIRVRSQAQQQQGESAGSAKAQSNNEPPLFPVNSLVDLVTLMPAYVFMRHPSYDVLTAARHYLIKLKQTNEKRQAVLLRKSSSSSSLSPLATSVASNLPRLQHTLTSNEDYGSSSSDNNENEEDEDEEGPAGQNTSSTSVSAKTASYIPRNAKQRRKAKRAQVRQNSIEEAKRAKAEYESAVATIVSNPFVATLEAADAFISSSTIGNNNSSVLHRGGDYDAFLLIDVAVSLRAVRRCGSYPTSFYDKMFGVWAGFVESRIRFLVYSLEALVESDAGRALLSVPDFCKANGLPLIVVEEGGDKEEGKGKTKDSIMEQPNNLNGGGIAGGSGGSSRNLPAVTTVGLAAIRPYPERIDRKVLIDANNSVFVEHLSGVNNCGTMAIGLKFRLALDEGKDDDASSEQNREAYYHRLCSKIVSEGISQLLQPAINDFLFAIESASTIASGDKLYCQQGPRFVVGEATPQGTTNHSHSHHNHHHQHHSKHAHRGGKEDSLTNAPPLPASSNAGASAAGPSQFVRDPLMLGPFCRLVFVPPSSPPSLTEASRHGFDVQEEDSNSVSLPVVINNDPPFFNYSSPAVAKALREILGDKKLAQSRSTTEAAAGQPIGGEVKAKTTGKADFTSIVGAKRARSQERPSADVSSTGACPASSKRVDDDVCTDETTNNNSIITAEDFARERAAMALLRRSQRLLRAESSRSALGSFSSSSSLSLLCRSFPPRENTALSSASETLNTQTAHRQGSLRAPPPPPPTLPSSSACGDGLLPMPTMHEEHRSLDGRLENSDNSSLRMIVDGASIINDALYPRSSEDTSTLASIFTHTPGALTEAQPPSHYGRSVKPMPALAVHKQDASLFGRGDGEENEENGERTHCPHSSRRRVVSYWDYVRCIPEELCLPME